MGTETPSVLVEVGAGDYSFTPAEVAELLALLDAAQRRLDGLSGVVGRKEPPPSERLSKLLRDAVQDLPVPDRCTGYWDEFALLAHDGDTCPIHELDPERD